ncbi:hypothetical protein EYR40_004163 [Pleurotus pulmonarius]|nr:hypothetical protein EYR36_007265 [Pleurotus pulmonarius]KAF4605379.1 hypothetical protein EYR40_004163 [Pleurotus pulmonarius]KAF4606869.1 hypothetical protein EYR38_000924 [Pleurotus pulmonarius]
MVPWIASLLLLGWLRIVVAFSVKGDILWNDICPGPEKLGRSKVVLDEGQYYGGIQQDGKFTIPDVPAGTYVLSVLTHDFVFDQLRVDILNTTPPAVEVHPYIPGTPLNPPSSVILPHPISLVARQKHDYFVAHESFSLLAMFKNPMMMIMLVTAVMAIGTPYLMKNMDPEALEEMRASQAKIASAQSAFATGDFKSSISALMSDEPAAVPQPQPKAVPAQNKSRSNKNKRR